MRLVSALIIATIMLSNATPSLAKSPAERERFKQSTHFAERDSTADSAKARYAAPVELEPGEIGVGDGPVAEPENNCNGRWFRPLVSALGSIAGVVVGGNIGGNGTSQQIGRIMGGAAAGVATNEVVKEVCE